MDIESTIIHSNTQPRNFHTVTTWRRRFSEKGLQERLKGIDHRVGQVLAKVQNLVQDTFELVYNCPVRQLNSGLITFELTLTGTKYRAEDRNVVNDFRNGAQCGLVGIDDILEERFQVIFTIIECETLPRTKFAKCRLEPTNVGVEFCQLRCTILLKLAIVPFYS